MVIRTLTISTLAAALAACAVGPDHVRPTPYAPENFVRAEATASTAAAAGGSAESADSAASDAEFWRARLPVFADDFRRDAALRLALFPRERTAPSIVGTINFTQIFRGPFHACYLGYSIAERWEGHGLMREGLEAAIAYAFDELRLHRIMANYVPTNERSGGLLRRLGFVVEGYARDYLYIDGAWRDHVLTALTNPKVERP